MAAPELARDTPQPPGGVPCTLGGIDVAARTVSANRARWRGRRNSSAGTQVLNPAGRLRDHERRPHRVCRARSGTARSVRLASARLASARAASSGVSSYEFGYELVGGAWWVPDCRLGSRLRAGLRHTRGLSCTATCRTSPTAATRTTGVLPMNRRIGSLACPAPRLPRLCVAHAAPWQPFRSHAVATLAWRGTGRSVTSLAPRPSPTSSRLSTSLVSSCIRPQRFDAHDHRVCAAAAPAPAPRSVFPGGYNILAIDLEV